MAPRQIYKTADGKRVPSVTTIISRFKDSGGLLYWANNQGLDGKTLEEARRPAADAGTLAHAMVEAELQGEDDPIEFAIAHDQLGCDGPMINAARTAYGNYLKWRDNSRMTFEYTEVPLISERYRVGGRADAFGRDSDKAFCLVDWKAANAIYADYLIQIAAYGLLWEENYPDHLITGGYHLVRFAKETADFTHSYFGDLSHERDVFIRLRALYDDMKKIEKRAR